MTIIMEILEWTNKFAIKRLINFSLNFRHFAIFVH